jgi:hypothetical protein
MHEPPFDGFGNSMIVHGSEPQMYEKECDGEIKTFFAFFHNPNQQKCSAYRCNNNQTRM